ncbi:MAG TPA: Dyp-type peroxidase [Gaiellaceae bacterium]|nr:Dyp-type peroxidase [Gaiellaceae bacterium]
MSDLERGDIQGLFARGYSNLPCAAFLVLRLEDHGREWLAAALPAVTSSDDRPEQRAVNVAFSSGGLRRLGLDAESLGRFSNEFVTGMTTPHRRRLLADDGPSAPSGWDWGGPDTPEVDAALLLYASDAQELTRLEGEQVGLLRRHGVQVLRRLGTSDLDGIEPFGFRDGISQPLVEGLGKTGPPQLTVKAGEFVLGYPNEYGLVTDHPPIGRNGSYLVFRQLEQDVHGFWRFLDAATRTGDGAEDPAARLRLAAKLVGRWPSGAPLALAPEADDPALAEENDFRYHAEDVRGARCPVAAHIRRANPRDSLDPDPGTDDSFAVNRRHRILRRGREYGPSLAAEDALRSAHDGEARGLQFLCLNANIARQFEFVQHTWLNNAKFAGLYDDADPLVGPSEPYGGTFTAPGEPLRERYTGVPRFVTVKGGAYFFMPGLAALGSLAGAGEPGNSSSPVGS